jgi:hypothetical protein
VTLAAFLAVALLHLMAAISPGPAVLMAARVAVVARAIPVAIAVTISVAVLILALILATLLHARFILFRHNALIVFRILEIGFGKDPVAAGMGVTRVLLVLFEHLLGRTADLHIRADTLEVAVGIVEGVLLIAAWAPVATA